MKKLSWKQGASLFTEKLFPIVFAKLPGSLGAEHPWEQALGLCKCLLALLKSCMDTLTPKTTTPAHKKTPTFTSHR